MLDLISDIANAIGTARPPRQEPGAVGAFWSVAVPQAAAVVPHLMRYAELGHFEAGGGKATLTAIRPHPMEFLEVSGEVILPRWRSPLSLELPYPNDNIRRLCNEQPAQFGRLELQLSGNLLPSLRMTDDKDYPCVIRWEKPLWACLAPQGFVRRMLRWATTFEIQGLRIGPTGGELLTSGLKGRLLPSFTW